MIQKFLNHSGLLGHHYHPYRTISGPKQTYVYKGYDSYKKYYLRWVLVRIIIDNKLKFADGVHTMTVTTIKNQNYKRDLLLIRERITPGGVVTI